MAKKQGKGNPARAKLPAGFTAFAVGGGFGAWWDHSKQKKLAGKVTGFDTFDQEKKQGKKTVMVKRGVMRVTQADGVTVSVGEQAALRELFMPANKKKLVGHQIEIHFRGQKKFKKDGEARKLNLFDVFVK